MQQSGDQLRAAFGSKRRDAIPGDMCQLGQELIDRMPGQVQAELDPDSADREQIAERLQLVISKLQTTRDGDFLLALKGEMLDRETTDKVKALLRLQRAGVLLVKFEPAENERLPAAIS